MDKRNTPDRLSIIENIKYVKYVTGSKANAADLSTVATTGSYNDLSDKPTTPTVPTKTSDFQNDSGYQTAVQVQEPCGASPNKYNKRRKF